MKFNRAAIISTIVDQHAEDVAMHWHNRTRAVDAPHLTLTTLGRVDARLQASLDGVRVAKPMQKDAKSEDDIGFGYLFSDIVLAIENNAQESLVRSLKIAKAVPESQAAVHSAFAWVSRADLKHTLPKLLGSSNKFLQQIGFFTCASHQFNLVKSFDAALADPEATFRAFALSTMTHLGQDNHLAQCLSAISDPDPRCAYEAAKACVFLGNKHQSVAALMTIAAKANPYRADAIRLLTQVQSPAEVLETLKPLSKEPASTRLLIQAVALAGDPYYVPWLIEQMQDANLSRIAGEAFCMITGVDLAALDLDCKPPEHNDLEPNDDPLDDNIAISEDDGLAWPNVDRISHWWKANHARFTKGVRYFVGNEPSADHCATVLKTGFQRQRKAAALHLALLAPSNPIFNTAAPAWRQQRILGTLS
jgi:uncharacterized protein (TIGR02270 family)